MKETPSLEDFTALVSTVNELRADLAVVRARLSDAGKVILSARKDLDDAKALATSLARRLEASEASRSGVERSLRHLRERREQELVSILASLGGDSRPLEDLCVSAPLCAEVDDQASDPSKSSGSELVDAFLSGGLSRELVTLSVAVSDLTAMVGAQRAHIGLLLASHEELRAERDAALDARDVGHLRGWRAGVDAAARFHEQRASFSNTLAVFVESGKAGTLTDFVEEVSANHVESAAQDRLDAMSIRSLRMPESFPDAARVADDGLRRLFQKTVDQWKQNARMARERAHRIALEFASALLRLPACVACEKAGDVTLASGVSRGSPACVAHGGDSDGLRFPWADIVESLSGDVRAALMEASRDGGGRR